MVRALFVLIVLAGLAAWLTRPDEAAAEEALKEQLLLLLAKEDVGTGKSAAGNLALITCKMRPSDCYTLVRSQIETQFDDNILYSRFRINGFDRTADCIGAFTTFFCPGGLRASE